MSFLLDWELTMKCNLDCSYCPVGIYGGHDNSIAHPKLADCIATLNFMYEYVDRMMAGRVNSLRYVVLNVYGGESLHHPNIVDILTKVRQLHQPYKDRWHLTVTTTTNAIVGHNKFSHIIDLIDEFTVSWHSNNTDRQKKIFRENVLRIKDRGKRVKCVVLLHPDLFEDAQDQIEWCNQNQIKYIDRQLDHPKDDTRFNYSATQVVWFEKLYKKSLMPVLDANNKADLADTGRACCGGRLICEDKQYRNGQKFVHNKFPGWYCSVDKFFLYVKQVNGEVFVNRDCKMNYQGQVGPIGNLNNTAAILQNIGITAPIQCAKSKCICGLCAPKAADLPMFNDIMRKYEIPYHNLLS